MGNDTIHFARKVSSEETYDFLRFYVDNVLQDEWSGEEAWNTVSYAVTEGYHTLLWSYEKDYSMSSGDDCGWIDNIIFPATTVAVNVHEQTGKNEVVVYPNPGNGQFYINLNEPAKQRINLMVFNGQGKEVLKKTVPANTHSFSLDLSEAGKGLYLLYLKDNGVIKVTRLIVK